MRDDLVSAHLPSDSQARGWIRLCRANPRRGHLDRVQQEAVQHRSEHGCPIRGPAHLLHSSSLHGRPQGRQTHLLL